jgi:hypothetical protein
MAGVGLGPEQHGVSEKASVTVYQNTLAPAGRGAEKNDIYLNDTKVVYPRENCIAPAMQTLVGGG